MLEPGKPVMEIARQGGFRFEAAVPSEEVGHLRNGMPARVKLDAFDCRFTGTRRQHGLLHLARLGCRRNLVKEALYTVKILLSRAEVGRGMRVGRVKLGMTGRVDIITSRRASSSCS